MKRRKLRALTEDERELLSRSPSDVELPTNPIAREEEIDRLAREPLK